MQRTALWIAVVSLSATGAFARSFAGHGAGARGQGFVPFPRPTMRAARYGGYYPSPFYGGGYDYGYEPGQSVGSADGLGPMVIVQAPPPPPVRADIREYKPVDASGTAITGETPMFAIALKSGTVQSASAVWADGKELHYVDPDGRHMRVSLDAVDRDATRKLNAERKLQLRVPPAR